MHFKMQRQIGLLLLGLTFCFQFSFAFAAGADHRKNLNEKFPYGLLGDDYGILRPGDLALNVCNAVARPLSAESHAYQYWQCFESKRLSFECEDNGIPFKYEGVMGLLAVTVQSSQVQNVYMESRIWPMRDCKKFLKDVRGLLKGSEYACISGSFINEETDGLGRQFRYWRFDRVRTMKGCEGHECYFTKEYKKENCPRKKIY